MKGLNRWISFVLVLTMLLSFPGEMALASGAEPAQNDPVTEIGAADPTEPSPDPELPGEGETADPAETPEAEGTTPAPSETQEPEETSAPAESTETPEPTDTPEPTAAPVVIEQRTIEAELDRTQLFDENEHPTPALLSARGFWSALLGREPELTEKLSRNSIPVVAEISGVLPSDLRAELSVIEYAEAERYGENALFTFALTLRDGEGNPYIPQEEISLRIYGDTVDHSLREDRPVFVYLYAEKPQRAEELAADFAADVLVYRSDMGENARASYRVNDDQAVRFAEDENGLTVQKDDTFTFTYTFAPDAADATLIMALSDQLTERYVEAESPEGSSVSLFGLLPEQVSAQLTPAETLPKLAGESLLALDLRLSNGEEDYRPAHALSVVLRDPVIAEHTAAGEELAVWHVDAEGTARQLKDAKFQDEELSFAAAPGTIVITREAKDVYYYKYAQGDTWSVVAAYGADAGIPENAELTVTELMKGSEEYDNYVNQMAAALGVEAKHFTFAHAFDISLTDPATGEHFQPDRNVKISIELPNEDIAQGDIIRVVHFPEAEEGETVVEHQDRRFNAARTQGGAPDVEVLGAAVVNGAVQFESGSFSVYVVAKEALMQHFVFLNDWDGGMTDANRSNYIYAEQVLIDGEYVVKPADPTKSGAVFSHWAEAKDGEAALTFPIAVTIDEDSIEGANQEAKQAWLDNDANKTYYYAVYEASKTTITFYNQSGLIVEKIEVTKPAAGEAANTYDTRKTTYLPIQDKEGTVILFKYWTDDVRGSGNEVGTNGVLSITADSPNEIELYPKLDDGHNIYFEGNKEAFELSSVDFTAAETVVSSSGASDADIQRKANEVAASLNSRSNHGIPSSPGFEFTGWFVRASGNHDNDTDPSTKTKPVFYPEGGELKADWAEYKTLLDNFGNLPNNPTLYAHWVKKTTADYTVVIWREKLPDAYTPETAYDQSAPKEYVFAESIVIHNASTSGTVNLANYGNRGTDTDTSSEYYGYHYNAAASDTTITVKPDGSTVANVYYDLDLLTLNFGTGSHTEYVYTPTTSNSGTQYGLVNGTYVELSKSGSNWRYRNAYYQWVNYTGTRYTRSTQTVVDTVFSITEPFGRNISAIFPIVGTNGHTYNDGERWDPKTPQTTYSGQSRTVFSEVLVYLDTMPIVNVNFEVNTSTNELKTLDYFVEVLPGETATETRNGVGYKLHHETRARYGYFTEAEDFLEITGFTKNGVEGFQNNGRAANYVWGSGSNAVSIKAYYLRNSYNLHYHVNYPSGSGVVVPDGKSTDQSVEVPYQQPLASYESSFSPNVPNGYLFEGWYADAGGAVRVFLHEPTQEEIDATKDENGNPQYVKYTTMPSNDIQLYAKWAGIKVRARLIPNGGELAPGQGVQFHQDPTIPEKIGAPADPTRDYVHIGKGEDGAYHGLYNYDAVNGHYTMAPEQDGEYNIKAGAYLFQGWYEGVMDASKKQLVDRGGNRYAYAYGDYVEAAGGDYSLINGKYVYTKGSGSYNFVNADPAKNADGSYQVGRIFDFGTAPMEPVTLVAVWQRADQLRVVYDVKDPALNLSDAAYKGVTAPEDNGDYLDGAHATVLAPLAAPKGYALDYWSDKNGKTYKPNELVTVNEANADETASGDLVVTLTAHYRVYDPTARDMADYTFRVRNEETGEYDVYEVQRISVNEELKAPITPTAPAGYVFKGWYLDTEGKRLFNGFGKIASPTYTTLYAVFERVFTVTYYLTDATKSPNVPTSSVIATQTYTDPGVEYSPSTASQFQHLDTRGVTHPVDNDHYVAMWVSDWNHRGETGYQYQYKTMTDRPVTKSMSLYAVLTERMYVNFDSQGGSFVDMQEIPQLGWPVRPDTPTRKGYSFEGWFTQPDGGAEYTFGGPIDELTAQDPDFDPNNAVLYAHWESDGSLSSDFTIIWWAETAEGNGNYEFQKSAKATGTVGVVTNTADYLASHTTYDDTDNLVVIAEEKRPYFEYNSTESDSSFVVEADGSTVLNLRFTRIRYTYRFNPGTLAKIVYNGHEYTNAANNRYEFEVWLDKEIASQWPMADNTRDPHITITDSSATGVRWKVGSDTIMAVETAASNGRLKYADSNRVVLFTSEKVTSSQTTIIRYYLGEAEAADYRSVTKANISSDGTYNGLKFNGTYLPKTITGYHPIVIKDGDTPIVTNGYHVRGKDVGVTDTSSYKYNRIYGRYESVTSSGTEEYQVTLYSYARKDNVQYYVWVSQLGFDTFYPVNISFHNDRETKNSYEVTYTDRNGNTHQITGGTIYYVANGAEPYRIGLGLLARTNTTAITWDNFVNNAIQESTRTETRTRPVESGITINYVTFYYAKNIYTVNLLNGTTPYGSVDVEYERYVPEALAEAGITDPVSTQEGMTFAGWSITEDTVEPYNHNMPAYNLTLYATWKPVEYTVTTLGVDIYGNGFTCDEQGREIDADGNLVPNGKVSATYTAKHGQQLKELGIPNPKSDGKLFSGWLNNATSGPVTGVYEIKGDLVIRPEWDSLELRHVTYDANFPDPLPAPFEGDAPTAPTDDNQYIVGAKANIKDSNGLYINRKDVMGQIYRASFAFWEDSEGNRYYPNTVFVFRKGEETGMIDSDNDGVKDTLALKAVYSEFRETVLTYDKNDGGDDSAKFIKANADGSEFVDSDGKNEDYTIKDKDDNTVNMKDGPVNVLYRDERSEGFVKTKDMIPNQTFPVGLDQYGNHFTVVRTDALGNKFYFAGWSDHPNDSIALARNGDKAYVNTVTDSDGVLRNTLYAIWGICKIMTHEQDRWRTWHDYEHVFPTIQAAVDYVNSDPTDTQGNKLFVNKTAVIHMLIDYKKPADDSVNIPSDCSITLTTAKTGVLLYDADDTTKNATITRAENGGSMFASSGSLTIKDITLDGGNTLTTPLSSTADGGIVKVNAGSLTIQTGAVLQNSTAPNGGAVYVASGAEMTMSTGTINGNIATTNGAGIYLENGATLKLSGAPDFGGSGVDGDGNPIASTTDSEGATVPTGNFVTKAGYKDKENGQKKYPASNAVRQDIFLAETGSEDETSAAYVPTTIKITGDITSGDGTIWVWAENSGRYKQFMPFAKADGVEFADAPTGSQLSAAHLKAFRNAQDDETTENGTDTYLYGTTVGELEGQNIIYWTGVSGSRKVVLRKVNDSFKPLPGAVFAVFQGGGANPYVVKDKEAGTQETLSGLTAKSSGILWTGNLPFGVYYLQETTVPEGYEGAGSYELNADGGQWFYLVVNANGVTVSNAFDTRADAKSDYEAHKT